MANSKVPEGMRAVYAVIPEATWQLLASVMDETGRGIGPELDHAIRRHAAQRPQVMAPTLDPAVVERPAEGKPRRGRPRK